MFNGFWPFFSEAYQAVIFVFIISLIAIIIIIVDLIKSDNISKKVFLVIECLFLAYTGWGLL